MASLPIDWIQRWTADGDRFRWPLALYRGARVSGIDRATVHRGSCWPDSRLVAVCLFLSRSLPICGRSHLAEASRRSISAFAATGRAGLDCLVDKGRDDRPGMPDALGLDGRALAIPSGIIVAKNLVYLQFSRE